MDITPTISIVTPCLNQKNYIRATLEAVLSQKYPHLEYIVIDGGSTDGSWEIIQEYAPQLAYYESQPDNGLYHALQKGFARSTGELMAWLNADDLLLPHALSVVGEAFANLPQVQWLQGFPSLADTQGRIIKTAFVPVSKYFFYSKQYLATGSYIQQESTFWRRSLWQQAGSHITQNYRYAGDFELWIRFFQYAPLHILHAPVGAFRLRGTGQLTTDHYEQYEQETLQILAQYPLNPVEQRILQKRIFRDKIIGKMTYYIHRLFDKLIPPDTTLLTDSIYFNRQEQRFLYR